MSTAVRFKASWGTATWIITLFTMVLIVTLAVLLIVAPRFGDHHAGGLEALIAAGVLLIPAITALFVPLGYELNDEGLVVRRYGPDIRVPWREIASIEPRVWSLWKSLGLRLFGDGGLFGFAGWFWTRDLRTMRVSATRLDTLVVIHRRDARPLILSPDDREAFIAAVEQHIG